MTSAMTTAVPPSLPTRRLVGVLVSALRRLHRLLTRVTRGARALVRVASTFPWRVRAGQCQPATICNQVSDCTPMRLVSSTPLTGALTALAPPAGA